MTTFRRSVVRSYGPNAITWWTWLLSLPFALTVMSGLQYVTGGPLAVLSVAALQHAILGGLLLLGAAILRVVPGRGRAFAVYTIFAVIGAVRPLLFLEAGGLLGIPVAPGDLAGRMLVNLVVCSVVFALTAVGVDLVREHRGVFRRLRAAQRASELDVECAGERLGRLRSTAVDEVLSAMEAAAAAASEERLEPREAARLLRTLAEDVVRPASHRVYSDEPALGPPDKEPLGRGEWSASVIGGMRAAPPLSTALLYTGLVVPFGLTLFGPPSLLPVATGFAVLLAAGAGVTVVPLPSRPSLRLATLVLLSVTIGILVAVTSAFGLVLTGLDGSAAWFEALTYPVIALAVALVSSLTSRVRSDQAELEKALQANVAAAARIRAEYDRERVSLARLLHASVQSELIAGALALTAAPAAGPETAALRIAEVVGRARDALRGGHEEPHAAEEVRALVESWSSAIELRARYGDDVWERLADPERASAVVDAVSEGLANAVRHGDGSPVEVELRPSGRDGVEVVIASGGTLDTRGPGIGLRQLAERGTVALRELPGRVELVVAVP